MKFSLVYYTDISYTSAGACTTLSSWQLAHWSSLVWCLMCVCWWSDVSVWKVDDEKVVSGSYDRTLKVWDIKTGQCRRTLRSVLISSVSLSLCELCHNGLLNIPSVLWFPSVFWRCWLGGRKGIRPVNWVVGCWRGYLSGAKCRLAYGPTDATATHYLLLQ